MVGNIEVCKTVLTTMGRSMMPSSPVWVLRVLGVVLLPQGPCQEVDDQNRHGEKTSHRGQSDAHNQRFGDKLLAMLPPIPPVLSNPTPAARVTGQHDKVTCARWLSVNLHSPADGTFSQKDVTFTVVEAEVALHLADALAG